MGSTRTDDRRLRLRGRRRHPGRPEGVRRHGRARHERDRRADRAEHDRRDRGARGAAGVRRAQLDAVFDDLGVDAAKTGMLFSRAMIETVADVPRAPPGPARRRPGDGRELRRTAAPGRRRRGAGRAGSSRSRRSSRRTCGGGGARRRRARGRASRAARELGAPAAIVTGGHGETAVDHLFDGREHVEIPSSGTTSRATHGAGCTHSAALAALLARGLPLVDAARGAARGQPRRSHGLPEMGAGDGPSTFSM